MEAVLEVQLAAPANDVREQVPIEGRIRRQDAAQVQHILGGDQLVKPHRPRRYLGPLAAGPGMVGVRPPLSDLLEDHMRSLDERATDRRVLRLAAQAADRRVEMPPRADKLAGGGFA